VRDLEAARTREFLAAGLSWLSGEHDIGQTMRYLGLLAHDLLRCFMGVHFRDHLAPPRVAVLSLGTLSARSMTFASDADLLFIHREGAGVEIQELAARAGGLLSPPGGPYPVDMRLRPEGRSAPTSVDPAYLSDYLTERASLWEYLALRRVRPLYGRRALLGEALDVIDNWLEGFRIDGDIRSQLRKIRTMQEDEVRKESQAVSREVLFDVKRSPGGMADIEYLALGLTGGRRAGRGPASAHIPDLIPPLVAASTFTAEEGDLLSDAYRQLRTLQVALQLHFGRDITRIPKEWFDESPPVVLPEGTMERLPAMIEQVRALFDREFPPSG
jgi:glutamate-ammonia-ligase adenylyltransferase